VRDRDVSLITNVVTMASLSETKEREVPTIMCGIVCVVEWEFRCESGHSGGQHCRVSSRLGVRLYDRTIAGLRKDFPKATGHRIVRPMVARECCGLRVKLLRVSSTLREQQLGLKS